MAMAEVSIGGLIRYFSDIVSDEFCDYSRAGKAGSWRRAETTDYLHIVAINLYKHLQYNIQYQELYTTNI